MEDEKYNEYTQVKIIERKKLTELKALHDEVKSLQSMIDANDKKMTLDFDFWYDIMKKKYEWESKNGKKIDLNGTNKTINTINSNNTNTNTNTNITRMSENTDTSNIKVKSDLDGYADRLNNIKLRISSELNK